MEADHASATSGPLAGLVLAVKDNVDVAGLPTTAACPGYSFVPDTDAPVVAVLKAAGAVVIGKTNLDQFATGLVGTPAPRPGTQRPTSRIHLGGSSSGSAVAVALGFADIAIGTDTAGSGRVPAGLQGIVGIKPTLGVVPNTGVVPACASYDCVTIFAADLPTAQAAMGVMATAEPHRAWPADLMLAAPPAPRVAVPAQVPELDVAWQAAFTEAVQRAQAAGFETVPIDMTPFFAAADLLYNGALVANDGTPSANSSKAPGRAPGWTRPCRRSSAPRAGTRPPTCCATVAASSTSATRRSQPSRDAMRCWCPPRPSIRVLPTSPPTRSG